MSRELIHEYFNEIDRLRKFSGTATEGVISKAFKDLLKGWARRKDLQFIAQYQFTGTVKLLAFGQASWQAEGDAGTEFKLRQQPR